MTKQVTKVVKVTGWKTRVSVDALGDLSGMTVEAPYFTVINGRSAVVSEWIDEATGDGYEQTVITLHTWE